MSTDTTTAGQPGAPSCSNGQQAAMPQGTALQLVLQCIGVLLHDVEGAEQAAARLEHEEGMGETVPCIRSCAALARQFAAFLADVSADTMRGGPTGLTLDDCAGYLLSFEYHKAVSTIVEAGQ